MSHCAWNSSGHDGLLKFIEPEVQVKVFLVYHVLPLALVSDLMFILVSMLLYLYCYRNSVYEYWGRCQTVPGIPPDTLVHWPKDPMSGFLPRSCIPHQCTVVCSATQSNTSHTRMPHLPHFHTYQPQYHTLPNTLPHIAAPISTNPARCPHRSGRHACLTLWYKSRLSESEVLDKF